MNKPPLFIDLETRSACDLRVRGAHAYARDATTRLLTVAWQTDNQDHVWLPGLTTEPNRVLVDLHLPGVRVHVGAAVPEELAREADRRVWVGHNAWTFDRVVWRHRTHGFDAVEWFDTYPLALAAGLPGGLDKIGKKLFGEGKYEAGAVSLKKAMKATGISDCGAENVPVGQVLLVAKYNVQDVRVTARAYEYLIQNLRLTDHERQVLAAHHAINDRGVRVDRKLVLDLIELTQCAKAKAIEEIAQITNGELPDQAAVQSRAKVLAWLDRQGFKFSSLKRDLVARFIDTHTDEDGDPYDATDEQSEGDREAPLTLPAVVRVLQLRLQALRITGGKLDSALHSIDADGRARGLFVYWGAHCVSGDTELLTRDGWQRIDRWTGGDIAQWSPDGTMRFAPATPNRFETDERTVTLTGPYASGVFTLGHQVPTYNTAGRFVVRQAGDMPGVAQCDLPLSGTLTDAGAITAEQMRVLVAAQADGHWVTDTRHGRGLQFTFRKERKIARIGQILAAAGIPYRVQEFPSCPGQVRVSVRWADCPEWLSPDRKTFGPWLLDSTAEARAAFMEEIGLWDGYDAGPGANVYYYSADPRNHEWVQTVAHLTGNAVAAPRQSHRCLVSCIRKTDRTRARTRHWTETPAIGVVYCPTTETGMWLYRHNGKVAVTHNTGRWAGRRIQVQNLPRPKDGVDVWGLIRLAETGGLTYQGVWDSLPFDARGSDGQRLYPLLSVDDAASALVRNIFVGNLAAADYAAIECRVLAWMAGEQWLLDAFWRGECPYLKMAERIVNRPRDQWPEYPDPKTGKPLPLKKHPYRQIVGKIPELAAGYQVGGAKLELYAAGMGFDLRAYGVTGNDAVKAYRMSHPAICGRYEGEWKGRPVFKDGLWHQLNGAALTALLTGQECYAGRCRFNRRDGCLVITLPSGRELVYHGARVEQVSPDWAKAEGKSVPAVAYESPRYGKKYLYGGAFAENVVQACARDILASALVRMEEAGIPVVLHCHDEAVADIPSERFDEFMSLMTQCPEWLTGFPLDAEGSVASRYCKSPPPGVKDVVWRNGKPL